MQWGLLLLVVAFVVGVAAKDEDWGEFTDYEVAANVEYVTFGENCNEVTSKCVEKSHLVCSPLGQCECPVDTVYVDETHNCESTQGQEPEVEPIEDNNINKSNETEAQEEVTVTDDPWPEEDVETWEFPANDEEQLSPPLNATEVKQVVLETKKAPEPEKKAEAESSIESKMWDSSEDNKETTVATEDDSHEHFWSDEEESEEWSDETSDEKTNESQKFVIGQPRDLSGGCTKDADCQTDGQHFRCNVLTHKCDCLGEDRVEVNSTCYIRRTINDHCNSEEECDAVIEGPAWCHTDLETSTTSCQCQVFSYWEPELSACLPYATKGLDSLCRRDAQCSGEEALGPHARCSEVTSKCECSNSLASEEINLIFFDGRCTAERSLNDTCRIDQDCEAALGIHAICNEQNKCSCKQGHDCTKILRIGSFSVETPEMSSLSVIILGLVGAVLLVSGVLFFVVRRKDNYTFVTNENDV